MGVWGVPEGRGGSPAEVGPGVRPRVGLEGVPGAKVRPRRGCGDLSPQPRGGSEVGVVWRAPGAPAGRIWAATAASLRSPACFRRLRREPGPAAGKAASNPLPGKLQKSSNLVLMDRMVACDPHDMHTCWLLYSQ